jgi:hypothetical protein
LAIPRSALTRWRHDKKFILQVDETLLVNAPSFSKDDWPDMDDRQWASNGKPRLLTKERVASKVTYAG